MRIFFGHTKCLNYHPWIFGGRRMLLFFYKVYFNKYICSNTIKKIIDVFHTSIFFGCIFFFLFVWNEIDFLMLRSIISKYFFYANPIIFISFKSVKNSLSDGTIFTKIEDNKFSHLAACANKSLNTISTNKKDIKIFFTAYNKYEIILGWDLGFISCWDFYDVF